MRDAVEKANEIVTLRSYFQHVISVKEITLKISESKLLAVCKGKIECSFDMSRASIYVSEANKHATIKMPPCEVKPIIDVNDVEVYDATRGVIDYLWDLARFGNKYDYNKVREIVDQERSKIAQEAQEKLRLIDHAQDNARNALKSLAAAFGYSADVTFDDDVNITFGDDSGSTFAPKELGRPSTVSIPVAVSEEARVR